MSGFLWRWLPVVALTAVGYTTACGGLTGRATVTAPPDAVRTDAVTTVTRPVAVTPNAGGGSEARPPRTLIAWSGRKALGIDASSGAVRELMSAPDNVEAYLSSYRFLASPDGTRFAYQCDAVGSANQAVVRRDICIWDENGPVLPALIAPEDLNQGVAVQPESWSPDGRRLVFVGELLAGSHSPYWTYVYDFETAQSLRLFNGMEVARAEWSPDGRRLAGANAAGLFVVDATTGASVNVAAGAMAEGSDAVVGEFAWSPDGGSLAFTFYQEGHYVEPLYVTAADGTGLRKIGTAGQGFAWSPDGRWVARELSPQALGLSSGGCLSGLCSKLYAVRADGSEDRELGAGFADAEHASWSPDSRRVAFLGSKTGDFQAAGYRGLYVTSLAGRDPLLLSADQQLYQRPTITWSDDGGRLLYLAYPKEIAGRVCGQGGCADGYLFMVDADGSRAPKQLYGDPAHEILVR